MLSQDFLLLFILVHPERLRCYKNVPFNFTLIIAIACAAWEHLFFITFHFHLTFLFFWSYFRLCQASPKGSFCIFEAIFYQADAISMAHCTVSEHWRQKTCIDLLTYACYTCCDEVIKRIIVAKEAFPWRNGEQFSGEAWWCRWNSRWFECWFARKWKQTRMQVMPRRNDPQAVEAEEQPPLNSQ